MKLQRGLSSWLDRKIAQLFIAPALLVTIATMILPLLYSMWLSFFNYSLLDVNNMQFVGIRNYIDLLANQFFKNSVAITAVYAAIATSIEAVLGMVFALLVNKMVKGQGVIRILVLIPMFITPVVVALIWRFLFHPELGFINYFLGTIGLNSKLTWLGDPRLALTSTILVDIWRGTPFMFLMFLAGIQSLPDDVYEAADIDGANSWTKFRYVTLPLLSPIILVSLIIRGMDALREFDTLFILTGGGPGNKTEVISLLAYRITFKNLDFGMGAAVSYAIFVLTVILCIVFVRYLQKLQVE
ncbi:carbohydrate ABC transporter permease [Moorella sp. Hama-1]|uniref:carbohydrate ABC transporter permease n=1 Tax=Moorella sp. Hama-1 TaxID=2138101 RepID=UPI000D658584|nr:sugar ABC transporter permease [Moorella sp. Hama-1]BCV22469.1 sugar ABC transporter permease [Moorella sp. Hama-1]